MTKKLLVVAASGLVLAILLLSIAWAIGGQEMMTAVHRGGWHITDDDDDKDGHGTVVTRSLTFDPAAPLTVNAPVEFHFVRGDHVAMTVSGSAPMLAGLRWQNNSLSMKTMPILSHHTLTVDIVAPHLPPLTFGGAGDVSLEKLDQDDLKLDLSGAGNVDASGRVRSVTATISGAGNVDLGELNATDATVDASGIGNVDVNANGKVALTVSGAGNVTLHRKPAQLTSRISGIGAVDQDY